VKTKGKKISKKSPVEKFDSNTDEVKLRIREMANGYKMAILFAEVDSEENPLDSNYSITDFSAPAFMDIDRMMAKYISDNKEAIEKSGLSDEQIGMDIWYTQAGHGVGFFDRDLDKSVEKDLTEGAKKLARFPSVEVGDDGVIYLTGLKYNSGGSLYANGGSVESLEKELHKLQRDLNSRRLQTYTEGDNSEEEKARQRERSVKLARFNEVLGLLREKESKSSTGSSMANGGVIPIVTGTMPTADGDIVGKVIYNDFWGKYQVYVDGSLYGEYNNADEAIDDLRRTGFKTLSRPETMGNGGGIKSNFKIISDDFQQREDEPSRVYHTVEGLFDGYWFVAKTDNSFKNRYGSDGINKGCVYKLDVWRGGNPVGRDKSTTGGHVSEDHIARYWNKWDEKPQGKKDKEAVAAIVDFLEANICDLKRSYTSVKFADGGSVYADGGQMGEITKNMTLWTVQGEPKFKSLKEANQRARELHSKHPNVTYRGNKMGLDEWVVMYGIDDFFEKDSEVVYSAGGGIYGIEKYLSRNLIEHITSLNEDQLRKMKNELLNEIGRSEKYDKDFKGSNRQFSLNKELDLINYRLGEKSTGGEMGNGGRITPSDIVVGRSYNYKLEQGTKVKYLKEQGSNYIFVDSRGQWVAISPAELEDSISLIGEMGDGGSAYAKGGSLKDISFENSNLYLYGFGRDTNGNSIIKVGFPNDRAFSIQINSPWFKHSYDKRGYSLSELTPEDVSLIEKEVVDYVREHGSDAQKAKLKIYGERLEKGGSMYAGGGSIQEIVGTTYRPFISSNPKYFVKVVKADFDNITYKHLDNGEEKTVRAKDFMDSYIQLASFGKGGSMYADGGVTGTELSPEEISQFEKVYNKYVAKDYFGTNDLIENKEKFRIQKAKEGDELAIRTTRADIENMFRAEDYKNNLNYFKKLKGFVDAGDHASLKKHVRPNQKLTIELMGIITGKDLKGYTSQVKMDEFIDTLKPRMGSGGSTYARGGEVSARELNNGNQYTYDVNGNSGSIYKEYGIYSVQGFENGKHFSKAQRNHDHQPYHLSLKIQTYLQKPFSFPYRKI